MTSGAGFQSTRWTQVLALRERDDAGYRAALESLAADYWQPVYGYIRRRGRRPAEAEDLVQRFFVLLMERDAFRGLEREGGSFRAYLLTAVRHFLVSDHRRRTARRRDPGRPILPLEGLEQAVAISGEADPDEEFERQWARQVIRLARQRMEDDCRRRDRVVAFEVFDRFVTGQVEGTGGPSQKDLAAEYGLSASQVNNYVHRGKLAFRRFLQEVVADFAGPEGVEPELEALREHLL